MTARCCAGGRGTRGAMRAPWPRSTFGASSGPFPPRPPLQVRLVIAEKGLPCEERDVSMPLLEHKEPWFMRLNLGEEVPVIIHRDNIISDYNQIIDYMEKNFTGGKGGQSRVAKLHRSGNLGLSEMLLAGCSRFSLRSFSCPQKEQ